MKRLTFLCLFFLTLHAFAYCGQRSRILLFDGSVINGEVVSYNNGIYVIRSDELGELSIESGKIFRMDSIDYSPANIANASVIDLNNSTSAGIDNYRKELMNDPKSAAVITTLAADPQIQEILKDQQIHEAAQAGDVEALIKNKKFIDMVNNPKLREAVDKIKKEGNAN